MSPEIPHPGSSEARSDAWAKLLGLAPAAKTEAAMADRRPRNVTADAGRTDSLLAHSIEYLTDSRELPSGRVTELSPAEPDVQAILLLMEARHQVYLDCPVIERRSMMSLLGMFKGPDRRRR